jgi:hypothetical protein
MSNDSKTNIDTPPRRQDETQGDDYVEPNDLERAVYARAGRAEIASQKNSAEDEWRRERDEAERLRRLAERAEIITLADIQHEIAGDMEFDVVGLREKTPHYETETFVENMRWYVGRWLIFVELERLLGTVTLGQYEDARSLFEYLRRKPSEAAKQVVAGDLSRYRRYPNLLLMLDEIAAEDDASAA